VVETRGPVSTSTTIPLALERQVEDFIASNLHLVEPGLRLFVDDNGRNGRQYPTDVGPIDLLCVRPNGDFLVLELKKQRVSDTVVGQLSRYLGWVIEELAESQRVFGLILSHEKDKNLTYAVKSNPTIAIRYYRIKIDFLQEHEL
jgi:RecB family endonuclease NucS